MADTNAPYKCTLRPELVIKAQTELNENPRTRLDAIESLRKKVLANKTLKAKTDDAFLLRFLRARKFDIDRAYNNLINYYKIRAENRSVFKNFTPSNVKHVLESGVVGVLPDRDSQGRRVLFNRPGKWNPENFTIWDMLRANIMTLEKIIEEEETQICGVVVILDLSEFGMTQVKNFERGYAKIMASCMQDSLPIRLKNIHFVHEPTVFDIVFSIVKQFMKEKIQKRLILHGSDMSNLHNNFISKDLLPEEVGGSKGPYSNQEWANTLLASEAMFKEMEKYEMVLIDANISHDKQTGAVAADSAITGSFKKLSTD